MATTAAPRPRRPIRLLSHPALARPAAPCTLPPSPPLSPADLYAAEYSLAVEDRRHPVFRPPSPTGEPRRTSSNLHSRRLWSRQHERSHRRQRLLPRTCRRCTRHAPSRRAGSPSCGGTSTCPLVTLCRHRLFRRGQCRATRVLRGRSTV
ncbi:hypothetical protein AMAG_18356 [Allomyces macrogynus ATCC 38327]|uniref:Uncharacterized protein n=1 Tax=Allomyces macrogynus (strain ATCC 38327) TaxID=578462 RepID=A0A0L0S641_ALLM3|nr:hypothetical protein AMAG_18356 [Allomyces macrogynus ATCC 38327]|eukprot:KNE57920.1 hypothetical protein AMAG_18356 [Allomyces macrogynus ATCC 38327]